jgi:hypothetical protein
MRSIMQIAIATTNLTLVARAAKVAILIEVLLDRDGISAPTLLRILGSDKCPVSSSTNRETAAVGVIVGIRIGESGELASGIVLFETSYVVVLCTSIC